MKKNSKLDKRVWYSFLVLIGICALIGLSSMITTINQAYNNRGCNLIGEGSCTYNGTLTINGSFCSFTTEYFCGYKIPSNCWVEGNNTLLCEGSP